MSILVWDKVGTRVYETGLDRGVLYLPDGSAVPWNGLTSVVEKFDKDMSPVYYDGVKISDLVSLGDFSGSMKAVTYPEEFVEIEGFGFLRKGLALGDQVPQTFGLSYRTRIGNDIDGDNVGYKIHIIYNVTAIPNDRAHETITSDTSVVEFEWDISTIPEEIPGFRPTAHVILSSVEIEPALLAYIEERLYGTEEVDASLIGINDLISYMYTWVRVEIVDNSDGTWTANCLFDEDLVFNETDTGLFTLIATGEYLDSNTYTISDTVNSPDILPEE
jgi:hypothetical protein